MRRSLFLCIVTNSIYYRPPLWLFFLFDHHHCLALTFRPLVPRSSRRIPTQLQVNVASDLVRRGNANEDNDNPSSKLANPPLSRPERKALERERKQARNNNNNGPRRRKHNFAERNDLLQRQQQYGRRGGGGEEGRYDLHSTVLPALNSTSSPDDIMRAIKRAQNLHDVHDLRNIERFLFEQTDTSFAYGFRGSLLARLAVAALHMNHHELARKAMDARRTEHRSTMLPLESAALIRGLLRVRNVSDALEILEDELALPDATDGTPLTHPNYKDLIKHRALSIASLASRYFFEKDPFMALLACQKLSILGPVVQEAGLAPEDVKMPWVRILSGAAECEAGRRNGTVTDPVGVDDKLPCNLVYSVLNAMMTFPSENDDRVYEVLSNSLVRRVVFVTGAIDMEGCPPDDRGEAVFIGRSNVGKSSLINMLTNRKSLAFTSKRPGKTQQFNFFAVNDKPGREKEIRFGDTLPGQKDLDSFYLVDVPGFGYAKVPEKQRQLWASFLRDYVARRSTLRCVFHLIDSRLGPTEEDASIMNHMSACLSRTAIYAVVLTKADKNVKTVTKSKPGKVSPDVLTSVHRALKENGLSRSPVILSSAETKLGRDDVWRYLRLAAEG